MLDTREFLAYCAETIARFGYVRTQDTGESTRDRATSYYGLEHGWYSGLYAKEIREELTREMEKVGFNAHRPQNAEKVTAALDWLSRQDVSGNYMHNLAVATALEFTVISNAGILCSLFPTYDRELEREAERAERARELARKAEMEKVSDWQGEVGKRVEFKPVEARIVTSWVNSFNPYGGMVYIWKIKDGDGNIYTWKTSNEFRENNDGSNTKYTNVTTLEYEGLLWLRDNTPEDSLIASDRYYSVPEHLYKVTSRGSNKHFAYAIFSQRRQYLEGSGYSLDTSQVGIREEMLAKNKALYDPGNDARGENARALGVDYVVISKRFNEVGDISNADYELCFSNDEMDIYKVRY
jgi:hypothetical protein